MRAFAYFNHKSQYSPPSSTTSNNPERMDGGNESAASSLHAMGNGMEVKQELPHISNPPVGCSTSSFVVVDGVN